MGLRTDLQTLLEGVIGSSAVYFQPPPTVKMVYPCIVYERFATDTRFADNRPYRWKKCYKIMVIDRDPDSDIPDKVAVLPMCVFDRHYTADNLNHDVFTMYF